MQTLTYVLNKLFQEKGNTYYKRMIDDYLEGNWNYDIKQLVEYRNVRRNIPLSFSPKGYRIERVRVVKDAAKFKEEMLKYYNEHIVPLSEIRKNRTLAKHTYLIRWGYITEGNQICQKAGYICENCINFKNGCEIAMKYTNNHPNIKRMTKILELIYGNLGRRICRLQVKEGLKYL